MIVQLFDDVTAEINEVSHGIGGSFEALPSVSCALIKGCFHNLPQDRPTIMFDVGANTGGFSFLPMVVPNLTVYAFEPSPEIFGYLVDNIALNGITDKVKVHDFALSNEIGECELHIPARGQCQSGLSSMRQIMHYIPEIGPNFPSEIIQIKTDTLDNFVEKNNIPFIDIIKLDVEGAEKLVLEGGLETIKKFNPVIMLEYSQRTASQFGYQLEEMDKLLEDLGYNTFYMFDLGDKVYTKSNNPRTVVEENLYHRYNARQPISNELFFWDHIK